MYIHVQYIQYMYVNCTLYMCINPNLFLYYVAKLCVCAMIGMGQYVVSVALHMYSNCTSLVPYISNSDMYIVFHNYR